MADAYPAAVPAQQPTQPAQQPPPDLDKLKRMFDDFRTLGLEGRQQSEIDRDYYDSAFSDASQLTATQRAVLKDRRQPEIIINRTKVAINGVMGVMVRGKTDPVAYMRNPPKDQPPQQQSPAAPGGMMGGAAPGPMGPAQPPPQPDLDAGDVATMSLRFIADTNQFQAIKLDVLENMAVEGCGAAVIELDDQNEVTITQVRWEEFFYDPRSRKHDFADARYKGIAKWMYADDVIAIPAFASKAAEILAALGTGDATGQSAFDQTWIDKPDDTARKPSWTDEKNRRLMVVEMYYKESGAWQRCVFHGGGLLLYGPSPYVDDKGRTICGIEAQSAFVDRKNRRYGLVRDMRGPQDEINMRRIKAVHEINTRQVQQVDPNAPPIDADVARAEAARPDGVLPTGWQIVPRQDVVANNINLLQEAKAEIERLGPVPAILARGNADASGRAKQVDQQAGMTELARFFGRVTDWEMRIYRQMWARARQGWSDPKWIRVTDDVGAPQYVRINEPASIDPMTGQPSGPPKNHIAQMDVDIIVDSVPDTATLQQEIFNEMMQLAQAYVGTPMMIPFNVLVEMSPLPKKRELLQKLEKAQAEAAQAAAPKQQLDTHQQIAETVKTQAEAQRSFADARKIETETTVSAMHGHMQAVGHAPPPGVRQPPPGANGNGQPPPG